MEEHINDNEPLTKFLEDKKDYEVATGAIKVSAFYPSNSYAAISVFCTSNLTDAEIWDIADSFVAPKRSPRNGSYRARADMKTVEVRGAGLRVEPETSEHPRHADILGWVTAPRTAGSEEAINEIREKRAEYAAKLLQISTFVRRSTSNQDAA